MLFTLLPQIKQIIIPFWYYQLREQMDIPKWQQIFDTNLNTSQHTQNLCVVFTSSPAKHELKMTPSHCFNPARLMTSSWLAWLQEYTEKPWSDQNTNYQYVPPTRTKHTLALVLASN